MELGILFIALMIGNVVLAVVAASIASSKGQSFYAYMLLGLFFSPAAVLVASLLTEPRARTLAQS